MSKHYEDYESMSITDLNALLSQVKATIDKKNQTVISAKLLVNIADLCKAAILQKRSKYHYNGGWIKCITGLDKSKTNGYSHLGSFVNTGVAYYPEGSLFLDCNIGGTRKNQEKTYYLCKLYNATTMAIIAETTSPSYATDLWPEIEKYLLEFESHGVE